MEVGLIDQALQRISNIIFLLTTGSGKTTFMQRLNSHLHQKNKQRPPYVINLDPAVFKVPFPTNIDIRDAVNYKKVMSEYNLGPNGAIVTSLNLFSTKIDQVLSILEKRAKSVDHVLVDTPGQIEVFIWSASGAIITDAMASTFPTMIAYIVDTPRSTSPATFMSNMLYACSILYKTKLPMIIVFNKTDVQDAQFAKDWMEDFEAFQQALRDDEELSGEGENSSGYMGSLMNSLSLMLEEFYKHLEPVAVSAYTGAGFDDFLAAVDRKVDEYNRDYKAEREAILKQRQDEAAKKKTRDLTRLMKDFGIKDDKAEGSGREPVDTISDTEEPGELDGEIDPDDDEFGPQRQYAYAEAEEAEAAGTDARTGGIQDRYKRALERSQVEHDAMQRILDESTKS